jgi:hypothetical protein
MRETFVKYSSKALAALALFVISYFTLAFVGWDIDFREWNWILRFLLLIAVVAPFTNNKYVKV